MSAEQKSNPPEGKAPESPVADESDPVEGAEAQTLSQESQEQAMSNVRHLLPTHLLPKTKTGRPVGRPRKINPQPTQNDLDYHAAMSEEKQRFITEDPVVKALSGRVDSANLLSTLRAEIAKEAAALHFTRIEAEKYGKDTAQTSTRRIDALTRIAHIELEIKKIAPDVIDVRGEKFQKIFRMFIEYLKETAQETLSPEAIDLFFNRFMTKMEGWEDKAIDIIR
jgi:hypothetical protein